MPMNDYQQANRELWDEYASIHTQEGLGFYKIKEFRAGESALHPLEIEELADHVQGKELLHLQCHFGLDTLSWLRHGAAHVTGVDFSPRSIELARTLAEETGLTERSTFVESSIEELPNNLSGQFDVVYTSYGVLIWLPDLKPWAAAINRFLKPGGTFYIAEYHPVSYILDDTVDELKIAYPYFTDGTVQEWVVEGSYADRNASYKGVSYEWPHTLGEVVTALAGTGLHIEYLHEHDYSNYAAFAFMDQVDDRKYRLREHADSMPMMFSIRATKLGE